MIAIWLNHRYVRVCAYDTNLNHLYTIYTINLIQYVSMYIKQHSFTIVSINNREENHDKSIHICNRVISFHLEYNLLYQKMEAINHIYEKKERVTVLASAYTHRTATHTVLTYSTLWSHHFTSFTVRYLEAINKYIGLFCCSQMVCFFFVRCFRSFETRKKNLQQMIYITQYQMPWWLWK